MWPHPPSAPQEAALRRGFDADGFPSRGPRMPQDQPPGSISSNSAGGDTKKSRPGGRARAASPATRPAGLPLAATLTAAARRVERGAAQRLCPLPVLGCLPCPLPRPATSKDLVCVPNQPGSSRHCVLFPAALLPICHQFTAPSPVAQSVCAVRLHDDFGCPAHEAAVACVRHRWRRPLQMRW